MKKVLLKKNEHKNKLVKEILRYRDNLVLIANNEYRMEQIILTDEVMFTKKKKKNKEV